MNNFIIEYQSNPIKYFYEEDLRADLLIRLWKEESFNIKLPITTNNEWLKDYRKIVGSEIYISGVKSEYPSNKRFDIALINADKITFSNCFNHYIFECLFALEIKLSQKDNNNSGFKSDIEKLRDYKKLYSKFTGIAINFEQNPNYDKNKVIEDYNNYNDLRFLEVEKPISISENTINYFFISRNYVLGGTVNAT
ncbi:MAG: hypothetical protein HXY48_10760 [Ignavibacteriaceae bacterium]|nr:hypothetical protein [Ignavibacteriaceae bacterium]